MIIGTNTEELRVGAAPGNTTFGQRNLKRKSMSMSQFEEKDKKTPHCSLLYNAILSYLLGLVHILLF